MKMRRDERTDWQYGYGRLTSAVLGRVGARVRTLT